MLLLLLQRSFHGQHHWDLVYITPRCNPPRHVSAAAAVLSMPAQPAAGLPSGSASALQPSEPTDSGVTGEELHTSTTQAAIDLGHGDS